MLLPCIAAGTLAVAVLVPLRDDRRGRKATVSGDLPLVALFPIDTAARDAARNDATPLVVPSAVAIRFTEEPVRHETLPIGASSTTTSNAGTEEPGTLAATPDLREAEAEQEPSEERSRGHGFGSRISAFVASALRFGLGDRETPSVQFKTSDDDGVHEERSFAEELALVDRVDRDAGATTSVHDEPNVRTEERVDVVDEEERLPEAAWNAPVAPAARSARTWSVPLTRVPLRPERPAVTWPLALPIPHVGASRAVRHEILTRSIAADVTSHVDALCAAYDQEDAAGRLLALRAIERCPGEAARSTLVDALQHGSDDERVVAIDALASRNDRAPLIEALSDRVDAVAARAALAYVQSDVRADYDRLLGSILERSRIDALLIFLAGVVA